MLAPYTVNIASTYATDVQCTRLKTAIHEILDFNSRKL